MAARYHVEFIVETGDLPPLLDHLATVPTYALQVRPVIEEAKVVSVRKVPNPQQVPGGIRTTINRVLGQANGKPVPWAIINKAVKRRGYAGMGSVIDTMVKTGEVKRVKPKFYTKGKVK